MPVRDQLLTGAARHMAELPDNSIALAVTSPPYFAGKDYELGDDGSVPATYGEYLAMLDAVLREVYRTLEPGGRLAINVANLGRKPYRSLSSDVVRLLEDAGWLLRGRVLWVKGQGANGSCAWGSFQSAANPVLRDVTEDVLVACKASFDRRPNRAKRKERGLPTRTRSGAGTSWLGPSTRGISLPNRRAGSVTPPVPRRTAPPLHRALQLPG